MDKNTITGFVLIGLVIIGFGYFSQPSAEERTEMMRQDSIRRAEAVLAEEAVAQAEAVKQQEKMEKAGDSTALFFEARSAEAQIVSLNNGLIDMKLSTKGAAIVSAELPKYRNQEGGSVQLLREGLNAMSFTFTGKEENIDSRDFTFAPVALTDTSVTMRLSEGEGCLDITYALHEGSYMVDMTVSAKGMDRVLHPGTRSMLIDWQDVAAQQEKGFDFEQRYSSLTYKMKDADTDYLSETSEKTETPEEAMDWVAFKNQFFSCVLIAGEQFDHATLYSKPLEKGSGDLKKYSAVMQTPFDPSGKVSTSLKLYLGPNDFHLLQQHDEKAYADRDLELQELVYLGWPLFRWINRWMILPLFDWLTGFGMSMGLVLLLLTIIVKAIVYPTTKKSYISSARMRVLKPRVDALSQQYPKPEDAMQKQAAMMQLYKEYGVSPMGGCLPMLIQMPIWIALFNFVPNAIQLRQQSFLWADDLSSYDELLHWNADLWLIGDHLSIFCVLFCLTNIINTWISMRQQKDQMSSEQAQQMKMMQYMMFAMPLMFFFMFNNYSSGLCYYYFLSGLTSVLIMWYLRKTTDDARLLAKLEEYREKHKNETKNPSGMAARLAALQKQMEEQKGK